MLWGMLQARKKALESLPMGLAGRGWPTAYLGGLYSRGRWAFNAVSLDMGIIKELISPTLRQGK